MIIQLIGQNGEYLQQMDFEMAKKIAIQNKLSLVKLANEHMYKMIDIGRLKYVQKKENAKLRLASRITKKHIDFKSNIGDNDLEIKLKTIRQFIQRGFKISIAVKHLKTTTSFISYNEFVNCLDDKLKTINNKFIGPKFTEHGDAMFYLIN